MRPDKAPVISAETTMSEYRKEYREKQQEYFKPENRPQLREEFKSGKLIDLILTPRAVDMKDFKGSEEEMSVEIESLYAMDGRAFDPKLVYPPGMIDSYGKEYALNAQGIYYFNSFRPDLVAVGRKVWVPSFEDINWEDPSECDRRKRARTIMKHNIDNETRHKSEYAWEADAWADVFNGMRNDPCLEVDKHDYLTEMPKTHPVRCTLTGKSKVVNRIPDATFGLATISDSTSDSLLHTGELSRERLERLLLHPKCGLLGDPKWGENDLVFPFAVYEAKGWSGDCRVARRQACQAGACYLDMLDNLARKPGPVGSTKVYQTKTSHEYQVFALTSFGAHWHLLVGHRRSRQKEEYAGTDGLSKTVYIFQRVWSARVTNERAAWELLSLIDQIHLWAITEFRTFVTKHLKPWHKFCDDNYLLDWDSVSDVKPELKQLRRISDGTDLPLPTWVNLLKRPAQRKMQAKAQISLARAALEHFHGQEKERCEIKLGWRCAVGRCFTSKETYTSGAWLSHLRDLHHFSEDKLTHLKQCVDKADAQDKERGHEDEEQRQCEEERQRGKETQDEELNGSKRDIRANGSKRCYVEDADEDDEILDGSSSYPPSRCIPGPSKRTRVV